MMDVGDVVTYDGTTAEWEVIGFKESTPRSGGESSTFVELKRADGTFPDFVNRIHLETGDFEVVRKG